MIRAGLLEARISARGAPVKIDVVEALQLTPEDSARWTALQTLLQALNPQQYHNEKDAPNRGVADIVNGADVGM